MNILEKMVIERVVTKLLNRLYRRDEANRSLQIRPECKFLSFEEMQQMIQGIIESEAR